MRFVFEANDYLNWAESSGGLPPVASIVKNLYWQGLWGVSCSVSDVRISAITALRNLAPLHVNYQADAIPDHIRLVLEGKPHSVTIWNDKREDFCYDPQLFARQLEDSIQPLRLEKISIRLQIEARPELVKETHKLGIRSVVIPFPDDGDMMTKCLQTAEKLGMSVLVTGIKDWREVHALKTYSSLYGLILNHVILQFIFEHGSRHALEELLRVVS